MAESCNKLKTSNLFSTFIVSSNRNRSALVCELLCSNSLFVGQLYENKNSAEVDIAPAFGEITIACNVGQAKKGHGACLKSGQLSVECKLKVKGTGSRFLLQECVKDNYYARFHPHC